MELILVLELCATRWLQWRIKSIADQPGSFACLRNWSLHWCGDLQTYALVKDYPVFSKGNSCIRPELLQFLIQIYNEKDFSWNSRTRVACASGDLAPLAHMSLLCIGKAKLSVQKEMSRICSSQEVFTPMLRMKEGLLTEPNILWLHSSMHCTNQIVGFKIANITSALSIDAFNCTMDFLNERNPSA